MKMHNKYIAAGNRKFGFSSQWKLEAGIML